MNDLFLLGCAGECRWRNEEGEEGTKKKDEGKFKKRE